MNYLFRDLLQSFLNVILNQTSTNKKNPDYFHRNRNNRELFRLVYCRAYFKLSCHSLLFDPAITYQAA